MSAINWEQPLKIDLRDYSEEEFDLFHAETGQELALFIRALESGEVNDGNLMIGANRKAIFTMAWLQFRRENPNLTREQVAKQGMGIIGSEIMRHVPDNGTSSPANPAGARQLEPTVVGPQQQRPSGQKWQP